MISPTRRFVMVAAVVVLLGGALTACFPADTVLRGHVALSTGQDAIGAVVSVFADPGDASPVATVTTNVGGHFWFTDDDLAAGVYAVKVDGQWWTGSGLSVDAGDAVGVVVMSPGAPTVLDIVVPVSPTVEGTLLTGWGGAAAGRIIAVLTTGGDVVTGVVTGLDGSFSVEIPAAGEYRLGVFDADTGTWVAVGEASYTVSQGQTLDVGTVSLPNPANAPRSIDAGDWHTCAVRGGNVMCWGLNYVGQLGDGSTDSSAQPVTVTGLTGAVSVTAGSVHSCALRVDGTVWCWGVNTSGQLGIGTLDTTSTVPVIVPGLTDVVSVSAGGYYTCAVVASGSVWCWGNGGSGELGNGSDASHTTPVQVSDISDAVAVEAGWQTTCALRSTGGVMCWGYNYYGELGNGDNATSLVPVPVTGITDATGISFGTEQGCAIRSGGALWCWGDNSFGQLGVPGYGASNVPVAVDGDGIGNVTAGGPGQNWTCAIQEPGTVLCWGQNHLGQLGNGTLESQTEPSVVPGFDDAIAITSRGAGHACAVRASGPIMCWGFNPYGQLGDGTTTDSPTPVVVYGTGLAAE